MKRNFVKSMSAIVFIITMATNSVVLAQRNKSDNGAADRARADAARAEAQRADSRRAEQRTADQRAEAQRAADLRDAAAKASKATAAKAEPARDEKKSPALSMSGFGQAAQTKSGTAVDDISARIKAADTLRRQRDEDERRREMPKAPERQERNPKVDDGELARQAKLKADLLPRQAAREREREVREDRDNGVGSDTGRLSAFKAELQAKKAIREGTATAADARPKGMTGLRQLEDDISARKARDERTQRKLEARRQVREGKVDWGYDSTQGKVSDHAAQGTTQFSDKARGAVAATPAATFPPAATLALPA